MQMHSSSNYVTYLSLKVAYSEQVLRDWVWAGEVCIRTGILRDDG